ncbi:PadR family transcriptional regulator [Heliophilum fasciatum]|uniref:PadR family transcriptional regulator n=1 Tax=Heliophilum fasciatum TaxID=35700 RepID=A0A4R2RKY9_9FIRM|nr:PadR family transcriptional regulator [Heliophilum fasciatum]MCW2278563.1 DNA-binding PadR family transcriptional regulator [Heliophilum fasciatum]TCP63518.1 PadR family transcriptional regulator [Heliophilum fasciatum]
MKGQDVILGLLFEEPLSGYDIKQHFEKHFPDMFVASFGTIYPTLNRMEKEGYIKKEIIPQDGKPNKHLYHITAQGKEAFFTYLNGPVEPKVVKYDFMMRLVFSHHVSSEQILTWLTHEASQLKADLLKFQALAKDDSLSSGRKLALKIGTAIHESGLAAVEECIAEVTEKGCHHESSPHRAGCCSQLIADADSLRAIHHC